MTNTLQFRCVNHIRRHELTTFIAIANHVANRHKTTVSRIDYNDSKSTNRTSCEHFKILPSKRLLEYLFKTLQDIDKDDTSKLDSNGHVSSVDFNTSHVEFLKRLLFEHFDNRSTTNFLDVPKNLFLNQLSTNRSLMSDMDLPVIIVLGPIAEDIHQLCNQFVSKYKTNSILCPIDAIPKLDITKSGRRATNQQCDQINPFDLITRFQNELRKINLNQRVQSCNGIIVTGFPRSLVDIQELKNYFPELHDQLMSVTKGVLLVDYEEDMLQDLLTPEQLVDYQNSLLKVAEYFDEMSLLSVIEGPRKLAPESRETISSADSLQGFVKGYEMPLNQFALVTMTIWSKERHATLRRVSDSTTTPEQRKAYDRQNGLDGIESGSCPIKLGDIESNAEREDSIVF